MTGANSPLRVLLAEDNPVDSNLLRMAFEGVHDWKVKITLAQNGEEAISLLQSQAGDPEARPDFVILDLNLPRFDGTEVLRIIRNTAGIADVPVAIFSSSPEDLIQSQLASAGVVADGLFTKPLDIDDFLALGSVLRCWYEASLQRTAARAST